MAIFVDNDTRLVVQGLTGSEGRFHGLRNRAYGTALVAGVTPGKGGQDVEGVPVLDTVAEAVEEHGANTAMVFVPAPFAADAVYEAIDAGTADVRLVAHYALPGTLEAYYQEAGRAGRDGAAARAVLLYDPRDRALQEWFIEHDAPAPDQLRTLHQALQQDGRAEVWTTVSRGQKPSWMAWRVSENTPEISACEAMIAARVAMTSIGMSSQPSAAAKNGFLIEPGSLTSSSAPWPK